MMIYQSHQSFWPRVNYYCICRTSLPRWGFFENKYVDVPDGDGNFDL